jgi:hypothetical protein
MIVDDQSGEDFGELYSYVLSAYPYSCCVSLSVAKLHAIEAWLTDNTVSFAISNFYAASEPFPEDVRFAWSFSITSSDYVVITNTSCKAMFRLQDSNAALLFKLTF